jgi:phosphonate transport system substrate-binding protein
LCAFYRDVACALGDLLGEPAFFVGDAAYEELAEVDIAFVCSLAYLEHPEIAGRFEPVAAPVLAAPRYGDEPVYWSDVIVRADSGLRGFADLRGRSWAFNEPYSQSGHGITRYHLTRLGATQSYFSRVIEAGRHDRCIGLVLSGEVDAAAIDSHVLETYFHAYPELELAMRVIDSLGPSPIQPVVVRRDLSRCRKDAIRAALVDLGHHPHGRDLLRRALVARFVAVDDSTYHPVRIMRDVAHAAGFAVLR